MSGYINVNSSGINKIIDIFQVALFLINDSNNNNNKLGE